MTRNADMDDSTDVEESGPKLLIHEDGLSVASLDIARALEKKNLSPSLVTAMVEGCPARWLANTFVIKDIVTEEPDNAARRGSMFHKVMELFFSLPAEDRTTSNLKKTVNDVLTSDEFKDLGLIPDAVAWLKDTINGYYEMGARPKKVQVATIKDRGRDKKGLEIFVKGKIGDTDRDILGFIDRLVVDSRDPSGQFLFVEDWKSGSEKHYNPKTKSDEGLAEQRQQIIYKTLLEQRGMKVSGARLIYPAARHMENVLVDDEDLRQRVVDDVKQADEDLTTMIEDNKFPFKPSFLCSWCPLFSICPVAMPLPRSQKAVKAAAGQPSPETLVPVIDFAR